MRNIFLAALVLALAALPAYANSERKRHAEKPDYDAYKRELHLELSLIPDEPLEVGKPVKVLAKLVDTGSGRAMPESTLKVVHEHAFYLLLIDPTLTDYQHIHPAATDTDGLYAFTFTPKLPGGYRGWADVTSVKTSKQQFVMADLGRIQGKGIDRKESTRAEAGGYVFTLTFDNPPKLKKERMATISVTDSSGAPVTRLEPVMGTFGHLVGFHDDLRTSLHTHPMGAEPKDAGARGGPQLEFHMKPEAAGFVRLFLQVKVDGRELFVPFGINVEGKQGKDFQFKSIF